MEESRYTKEVIKWFDHHFPEKWIEELRSSKGKPSAMDEHYKVQMFRQTMVAQYARLVLSGDHLTHEIKCVDELMNNRLEKFLEDQVDDDGKNPFAKFRAEEFKNLLYDIHRATKLIKYHVSITKKHIEDSADIYAFEAVGLERKESTNEVDLIDILELICDVCASEYRFSYNDEYIRRLVMYHVQLSSYEQTFFGSEVNFVILAAIEKVEFLISKLSLYSKNRSISYKVDFQTHSITLTDSEKEAEDNKFRKLCLDFYDPSRISKSEIQKWQECILQDKAEMWMIVYLMRYYYKCTQSKEQINKLTEIAQKHYNAYIASENRNIVDDRAERFFINYIYNSRFSFLSQYDASYDLAALQKDLEQIRVLQDETDIHNYHPYQKACDYMIRYIGDKLRDTSYTESLKGEWEYLNKCYEKLKENKDWCFRHQPYLMQFVYEFSQNKTKYGDVVVYFPSSVSRPLKFHEIAGNVRRVGNAVQWLELQIGHQEEKAEILMAKQKIDTLEDKNLKHIGYFITAATFLVGLLSIFIGNTGEVSIFQKMEYVSALGVILLLFVGFGYFALTEKPNKNTWKYSVMFVITMLLAVVLGWAAHVGYTNYKAEDDCPSNETNVLSEVLEADVTEDPVDVGVTKQEVRERLMCFKQLIENNDGYKLLRFQGKRTAKEEDLQLLFRFVWNGTQLSVDREVNNGRGPVDYKLSKGAGDATLVEFKLAGNSELKQNLKHQVEIYKAANRTESALIPIIYFTKEEYNSVQRILHELNQEDNEDIILIDATEKLSASKVK